MNSSAIFTIILVFLSAGISYSQNSAEIQNLLAGIDSTDEKNRSELYLELSWLYRTVDPEKSIEFATMGLDLSLQNEDQKNEGRFYNILGVTNTILGNYDTALEQFLRSLSIKEQLLDSAGIGLTLNNIGLIYQAFEDYPIAFRYFNKSLQIKTKYGDKNSVIISLNNLAIVSLKMNDIEKANTYVLEALQLVNKDVDSEELAITYSNLGQIEKEQKKFNSSMDNIFHSLDIYRKIDNKQGITHQLTILGDIEILRNRIDEAIRYLNSAKDTASKYNYAYLKRDIFRKLSEIYELNSEHKKAFEYFKQFKAISDSLQNENKDKRIIELQTKYESGKNLLKIQTLELDQQNRTRYYYLIITLLSLSSLILIYSRYRSSRKLNKMLQASEEFNSALLNNLPDLVIVHKNNKIIYTNDIVEKLFSLNKDELFDSSLSSYLTIPEGSADNGTYEVSFNLPGQPERIMSIRNCQVKYKNESAILTVLTDITDSKNINKELIKAKDRAEKSDRLKSEFLAQVSHEIRTPLNVILSWSNLLSKEFKDKLPEELGDAFEIIDEQINRSIRTIDLILNMSELQIGSYELIKREINLEEEILKKLHTEFSFQAARKNLTLELITKTRETLINGDEYSIYQSLRNLIENAIKYTNTGFIHSIIYRNADNKLCVDITDSGIGISEESFEDIFEPFRQEQQGYTRRFEGTGLGLSLVKKYLELNNASINLKSKKNVGTTFTVTFNQ